jgi:hypothetical protein
VASLSPSTTGYRIYYILDILGCVVVEVYAVVRTGFGLLYPLQVISDLNRPDPLYWLYALYPQSPGAPAGRRVPGAEAAPHRRRYKPPLLCRQVFCGRVLYLKRGKEGEPIFLARTGFFFYL